MAEVPFILGGPIMLVNSGSDGTQTTALVGTTVDYRLTSSVGKIVVQWSQLEQWLDAMCETLMKHHGDVRSDFRNMSTSRRIRCFAEHYKRAFPEQSKVRKELDSVLDCVWDAKRVRDAICHSKIIGHGGPPEPAIRFHGSALGKKHRPMRRKDLDDLVTKISVASAKIYDLCNAHRSGQYTDGDLEILSKTLSKARLIDVE